MILQLERTDVFKNFRNIPRCEHLESRAEEFSRKSHDISKSLSIQTLTLTWTLLLPLFGESAEENNSPN